MFLIIVDKSKFYFISFTIVLFIVFGLQPSGGQTPKGSACVISKTGKNGICEMLLKCPEVLNNFKTKGIAPQICSYIGRDSVVCCPSNLTTTTTTSPSITSRFGRSYDKCLEYAKSVYTIDKSPIGIANAPSQNRSVCGFIAKPLVVGGVKATPKEFPHMALIGYGEPNEKQWLCGGSLISEKFVMTAGHCLYSDDFGKVKYIRLGDLNKAVKLEVEDPQEFLVSETYIPKEYNPPSYYNDIALLKMDRAVTFNAFIRPACLFSNPKLENEKAIATGWGNIGFGDVDSDDLLKVTLNIVSQSSCNTSYQTKIGNNLQRGIDPELQLCAGGLTETKDTCEGDSGGPLQIYTPSDEIYCMYWVVGVTSFGKLCGIANTPGVYTRVSTFVPWIESIVWA